MAHYRTYTYLLLLLIAGSFSLWYYQNKNKPALSSLKITTTDIVSQTQKDATPTIDFSNAEILTFPDNRLDTSDWKTYRNDEFGFEVKYPHNWEVVWSNGGVQKDHKGDVFILPVNRKKPDGNGPGDDSGTNITISTKTLDGLVKELSLRGWFIRKYILIHNARGVIFSTKKPTGEWEMYNGAPVISRGDYLYSFTNSGGMYTSVYQNILLSFRFIK